VAMSLPNPPPAWPVLTREVPEDPSCTICRVALSDGNAVEVLTPRAIVTDTYLELLADLVAHPPPPPPKAGAQ
jgi:hypothetical protein